MNIRENVLNKLQKSKYMIAYLKNKKELIEKIEHQPFGFDNLAEVKVISDKLLVPALEEYRKIIKYVLRKLEEKEL